MARISITQSGNNAKNGYSLRLVAIDNRSRRHDVRITELDSDHAKMENHLRKVMSAARDKFDALKLIP